MKPSSPCRALWIATLLPFVCTGATIEERLKELETKVSQLSAENAALKKQVGLSDKGTGPALVTVAGKEKSLSIGGYLQVNGEAGEAADARFPANDRLLVRRARITLKGAFAEGFDFVFQSDFGNNSIGGVSGYRAQITDLAISWSKYTLATLTAGQFKTPYGYEQLLADTKTLTVERSLPNDSLTLSRQIGAMVSGTTSDKRLSYAAGLFNGNGVNNGANDNDQFLYVGRVNGTVLSNDRAVVTLGANAFTTRDTGAFVGTRTGRGLDAQLVAGAAGLYAEWFRTHFDRSSGIDTDAEGWSILGSWQLVPKTLQAVLRYETYDPNRALNGDDTHLWTIGANYFIKGDDIKLSVNYLLGDPAGPLPDQGRLLGRFQVIF